MSNSLNWPAEQLSNLSRDSAAPFEKAFDGDRIDELRDLVLTLLRELESLRPVQPSRAEGDLQTQVQQFESDLIRKALRRTAGNQARAARLLGVKPTTLNAKIQRYKILIRDQSRECEGVVSDHAIVA
jgi:transcriptional regulator with GAF, ATPase, and Fis domain